MDYNTRISDEQLAYLNSNLDLVNKYVSDRRRAYHCHFKPSDHIAVVRDQCDSCVFVQTNFSSDNLSYVCDWRELLQFVEDHNNSMPPILK